MSDAPPENAPLTLEQQQYLAGFAAGSGLAGAGGEPAGPAETVEKPIGPERIHHEAQDRVLAEGGKLSKEEKAKREKNALDLWDELVARARDGAYPKGTDVLLTKFHGLFYVAPAQDSYMCRMRLPGGLLGGHQLRGAAEIAERCGGGYLDVTTRANLQLREIPAEKPVEVLTRLLDLGIVTRGAGADNVRNITASPTAGIDPQELADTRELTRAMHHHLLHHRELYGLPRKFNIAFDGGGRIASLADTNDLAFAAARVPESHASPTFPAGIYFRLQLGGITGHGDFARDTGVMLPAEECIPVADAILRLYIAHGDRTDRTRARLKYLLDDWGFETFLDRVQEALGRPLPRFPLEACQPRTPPDPAAHVGVHAQTQPGLHYIGLVLPVGRIRSPQARVVAELAERYGSGTLRLTAWQNLLISDIPEADLPAVQAALAEADLASGAHSARAGLVACTGNRGCKYAAADTKGHALALAEHLESKLELDRPINIHLTGCHHSCAQHFIGDIGLLATSVTRGQEQVEGYHLYVGGGHGEAAAIGREVATDIPHDQLPERLEHLLAGYLEKRRDAEETFAEFARRTELAELRGLLDAQPVG